MFDLFGTVRLNHDQLEADSTGSGTSFAPDEGAMPFIKPHHLTNLSRRSATREGAF